MNDSSTNPPPSTPSRVATEADDDGDAASAPHEQPVGGTHSAEDAPSPPPAEERHDAEPGPTDEDHEQAGTDHTGSEDAPSPPPAEERHDAEPGPTDEDHEQAGTDHTGSEDAPSPPPAEERHDAEPGPTDEDHEQAGTDEPPGADEPPAADHATTESPDRPVDAPYDGGASTAELPLIDGAATGTPSEPSVTEPGNGEHDVAAGLAASHVALDTTEPETEGGITTPTTTEDAHEADIAGEEGLGPYRFHPDRPSPDREEVRPQHLRSPQPAAAGEVERDDTRQREPSRRRFYVLLASLALPVVLALIVVAWAVDNAVSSGRIQRNVEMAGQSIGGIGEESLPGVLDDIADDVATRDVAIEIDGQTHVVEGTSVGLSLDRQAVTEAALDAGRDDPLVLRPFKWAFSFLSPHEARVQYSVSETDVAAVLQFMQGEDRTSPVDPTIELRDGRFVVVPGQPGQDLDSAQVASDLLETAEASADPSDRIAVTAPGIEVEPRFTDEEAQQLADRANDITAEGLTVQANDNQQVLSTQQLRSWISATVTDEGNLELVFDREAAQGALPEMFSDLTAEPRNATVTLQGGQPVVQPSQAGVRCCGDESGGRIWNALQAGEDSVELDVQRLEPEYTTEEVRGWGVKQPIGGSRAWQAGAGDVPGPGPGFTTYYTAGQNRAHNIQLMARHVNGAVIPPGGRFSINERVGPRTTAKGYLEDGAIRDREHVEEVGGGVSQFSTTMFNAAFFAGLDITAHQPHSEYFSRYPPGREATMGHPHPDVVVENNTPHGVLITTSSTPSSVTVTFWSTPHASAEQTGISESSSGGCRHVSVTRTRTYPDGSSNTDTFSASYSSTEGEFC